MIWIWVCWIFLIHPILSRQFFSRPHPVLGQFTSSKTDELSRIESYDLAGREDPLLFVGIITRPSARERRDMIRAMFLTHRAFQDPNPKAVARFFVGLDGDVDIGDLFDEIRECKDLVVFQYRDEYRNLVEKVLSMFQYAEMRHRECPFILKMDDDVFVNMEYVLSILEGKDTSRPYYMGTFFYGIPAQRDKMAKDYISSEDYDGDVLPPFASGPAYILSMELVMSLMQHRPFSIVSPEDVTMGILTSTLVHPERVYLDSWITFDPKNNINDESPPNCIHPVTEPQMKWLYVALGQNKSLSVEQMRRFRKTFF